MSRKIKEVNARSMLSEKALFVRDAVIGASYDFVSMDHHGGLGARIAGVYSGSCSFKLSDGSTTTLSEDAIWCAISTVAS